MAICETASDLLVGYSALQWSCLHLRAFREANICEPSGVYQYWVHPKEEGYPQ